MLINKKFIGFILIITLFLQAQSAYAFYSSTLSSEASTIKKHIVESRKINGVGDFPTIYQNAKEANAGFLTTYIISIKKVIIKSLTDSFLDGISLLAGYWIDTRESMTNCLRDDIWGTQALQEEVLNELLKAAMLNDSTNSGILWADYQFLTYAIHGGDITRNGVKIPKGGLKNDYKDKYWFPNEQNYYLNCPYGDFQEAWKELKASLDNFSAIGKGTLEMGSFTLQGMKDEAKKRAIRKARKWVAENKLTLTLGGTNGGDSRSLLNGPGVKGLAKDIETELVYVGNIGDIIFNDTWQLIIKNRLTVDAMEYATAYEEAQKQKDLVTDQMQTAITYNLSLNNVSEESLKDIENILVRTNHAIQQAYSAEADINNLKKFCEKLRKLASSQCKNHAPANIPSCSL